MHWLLLSTFFILTFVKLVTELSLIFFLVKKVEITFYGTLERSGGQAGPGEGPIGGWRVASLGD